jgi:ribonuclease HI
MCKIANTINIYTDGSCHTQYTIGAWAAILQIDGNEILLKEHELNTTHNRMELIAVLKAIEYLKTNDLDKRDIHIFSDSQYVVHLIERKEKLRNQNFKSKSGNHLPNAELLELFLASIQDLAISFIKVKAHQKRNNERNINREVDMICRQLVRDLVPK